MSVALTRHWRADTCYAVTLSRGARYLEVATRASRSACRDREYQEPAAALTCGSSCGDAGGYRSRWRTTLLPNGLINQMNAFLVRDLLDAEPRRK